MREAAIPSHIDGHIYTAWLSSNCEPGSLKRAWSHLPTPSLGPLTVAHVMGKGSCHPAVASAPALPVR